MGYLSAEDEDVLLEIFNMGAGAAAGALSEMVGEEVFLTLPQIELASSRETIVSVPGPLLVVYQGFAAPFGTGQTVLTFPEQRVRPLLDKLAGAFVDDPDSLQQEALTEVGNILLNSCLARLSDLIREEIVVTVARFVRAPNLSAVIEQLHVQEVLLISVQFDLKDIVVEGRLVFSTDTTRLLPMVQMVKTAFSR